MTDFLQKFIDDISQAGCPPAKSADIIPDDKWRGYALAGDPPSKKVGYYRLKLEQGFAVGNYGNRRDGVTHTWFANDDHGPKVTPAERAALRARIDAERAQRDQEVIQRQEEVSALAAATYLSAQPCDLDNVYLARKKISPEGIAEDEDGNIIVPLLDTDSTLWSLQTICPDGSKYNSFKVNGEWISGGRKKGCFCQLPAFVQSKDILFCEGFATAYSVNKATGLHTVMCVDSGNILPVMEQFRAKYPHAKMVVCADNDAFKERNTGMEKGQQAAAQCGAAFVMPEFSDIDTKPTDWNDLHCLEGIEAVKEQIMQVVNAAVAPPEPQDDIPLPDHGYNDMMPDIIEPDKSCDLGLPFKILGHADEKYFYFPFGKRQIVSLGASAHSMANLLQLASLAQWENFVGTNKMPHAQMSMMAANAMMRIADSKGVFYEGGSVRGCGAWIDAGRVIIHCGDKLLVDGEVVDPKDIDSKFVYVSAPKMFSINDDPLSNADASKLRKICEAPTWQNPLSGTLLAGWLVIAPVCAALEWRPHIWITGQSGSGKSTIINRIVKPILGEVSLNVDGMTTESGIRGEMGYNVRPIIFDEAEGRGKDGKSMDGVLALARLSSSGSVIKKHGQKPFNARSCFCFSAINPPVREFADETRISMMNLIKNTRPTAQQDYEDLLVLIGETITPEYSRRLLARTIKNMATLIENADTFTKCARKVIKDPRAAIQVGTMIAGIYLLGSTGRISEADAERWISERDWEDHTAIGADSDPVRLMHHLSTAIIRIPQMQADFSIGTLIACAYGRQDTVPKKTADDTLRQYSIAVKSDGIFIGNKNQNLSKLLRETDWVNNWGRTLDKLEGATKAQPMYFSLGDKQRAVKIPLNFFFESNRIPSYKGDPAHQDEFEIPY